MQCRPTTESLERRLMLAFAPVGPEFRVNTFTTNLQAYPATAMDADGDFVVTWQSRNQDQVAGTTDGVYAQLYTAAGVPRGAEFLVNTTTFRNQTRPVVAMDAVGDFVIAWESSDVSDGGIFAQRYNAAGTRQGGEFGVNTTTGNTQTNPTVAMDADGDFVIAWQSYNQDAPFSQGVYAQRYGKTGAAVGAEFRANTFAATHQLNPTVAMDAAGDFVIAWESTQQDPDNSTGIYAQRYGASGATRGGEFRVNSYSVFVQTLPAAAMDAAGDFVVTWHGSNPEGGFAGVYAHRFDASGGSLGLDIRVNTTRGPQERYTAVAMDADGDFVITWQNEYGDANFGETSVLAQRFTNAGAFDGGEFRVNSTTLGNHRYPAAAMDADGDFLIAWAGYGQDPGDTKFDSGVYARRYAAPAGAPRAMQVYASGTTWTSAFKAYLQSQGLGSGQFGYAIGGGSTELADLPWRNVNQVSVTFGADVTAAQRHLAVGGVNVANYAITAFAYDPATHTGTWTLGQNVVNDKVLLDLDGDAATAGVAAVAGGALLDGDWATGGSFPSGNGAAGGDFRFRFDVLPGNVNRVGSVLADDFSAVKSRFFRSTAAPGSGATAYTVFHDLDGNGSIVADDFSFVKSRFFSALPGPEPTAAHSVLTTAPGGSGRFRSAGRGLFAGAAIAGAGDPRALLA